MADKRKSQEAPEKPGKKSFSRSPARLNYVAQNRRELNAARKQRKAKAAAAKKAANPPKVAKGTARKLRRPAIIAARNLAKENARRLAAGARSLTQGE